jgi:hypothetical protein
VLPPPPEPWAQARYGRDGALMSRLRRTLAALPADDIQRYDAASSIIGSTFSARFGEHVGPVTRWDSHTPALPRRLGGDGRGRIR